MKVRDALSKSGNSGDEKDKCPWYNELDKILGTRPTVCPADIVESYSLTDKTSSSQMIPSPSSSYSEEVDLDENGEKGITATGCRLIWLSKASSYRTCMKLSKNAKHRRTQSLRIC